MTAFLRAALRSTFVVRATAAALILPAAATAVAQNTTGESSGYVRDASGAVVPGASVTLTFPELAFARTAVTSAEGLFAFPGVPHGVATIRGELAGFRPAERRDLG